MVAAAWPKPAKKNLSPKQAEAVAKFKEAAILAKYAPAEDQMTSRQLAEGSQFLPRDLQYMAIYGRLATLFFTNGQRRYQLASRYELTELLDILGFAPGSILFRGPDFWEALSPGIDGQALTIEGGLPAWGAGGAGGSGRIVDGFRLIGNTPNPSGTAYNTKGSAMVFERGGRISELQFFARAQSSVIPFQASLFEIDALELNAPLGPLLARSGEITPIDINGALYRVPLPDLPHVQANRLYALLLSMPNVSGTAINRIYLGDNPGIAMVANGAASYPSGSIQIATPFPETGHLIEAIGTGCYSVGAIEIPAE